MKPGCRADPKHISWLSWNINKYFEYKKSTVRTIYDIRIVRRGDYVEMDFHGSGFLQNMVRILVGTLVEVGQGRRKPSDMPCIIESLDRQQAGITAPPQGLALTEVFYE